MLRSCHRSALLCALALWMSVSACSSATAADERPRLVITTDMGGDPDDRQSLIRLLLYSNQFDIEGLIASAAGVPGELSENIVRPELIREIVSAYGQVQPNLALHDAAYPPAERLLATIKSGNSYRGMANVGASHDTEGSNWIIDLADRRDARPLNIAIWGGSTDLAQSLWRVEHDRSPPEFKRFLLKLRVHAISNQDDTGPWIARSYRDLFYVLSGKPDASDPVYSVAQPEQRLSTFRGMFIGGDESLTSRVWLDEHVRHGHGPLGALYPDKTSTAPNPHGALKEGDTPSWFYFLENGLNAPSDPEFGGWGGRFDRATAKLYRDTVEHFEDVSDARASVWRWRPAFQADFQARMDWCVRPRDQANHAPAAVVAGDHSREPIEIEATTGTTIDLSAAESTDPDGDALDYRWYVYTDAGTYQGPAPFERATGDTLRFTAPETRFPRTIHVILEVQDDGEPRLTSYRRVVVNVVPKHNVDASSRR